MNCKSHAAKVLEWKVTLIDGQAIQEPSLYGCVWCDATSETTWAKVEEESIHSTHNRYTEGCFACKIRTLEMNAGDAKSSVTATSYTQKKWDKELQAYRDARSQGIQPAGTTMQHINEARDASDKLGVAYNAEAMPAAPKITKQTASVMKETGTI